MKFKFSILALSAMALVTSCSNDETTDVNMGKGIQFAVTSGSISRATPTTTSSIDEFKVFAFTDGKTYMNGVEVTKTGDKWGYSLTKFWPETDVDFFAVSPMVPASGTLSITTESKNLNGYEVNGTEDLLYASNIGEQKAAHASSPVDVNFHHALSQVVFMVKNTNAAIKVKVNGIKIDGVAYKGDLTWATATTSPYLETNTGAETEATGKATWGVWNVNEGVKEFEVVNLANAFDVTDQAQFLTEKANDGSIFMLPQLLNPWLTLDGEDAKITGTARILVNCQIVDADTNIQLWPKVAAEGETQAEYGWVAISLNHLVDAQGNKLTNLNGATVDWQQGKRYLYTLIFGEGGGYEPDPDPVNPDDPDPVLVPIKFTVTVDMFQDGGKIDLNSNL